MSLLCAEGFSSLLHKAETDGRIKGVKICPRAPSISHLLFADDSLIFIRANKENALHLQGILHLYELCSGQIINKDKSTVLFSKNTSNQHKEEVMHELQITKETMNEKYLGLPSSLCGKVENKSF